MTLRTEIEALLVEFDHFAYDGAPLDVAVEKLQEILARTAPRVLTTVEELDSEEVAKALCLVPADGSGILGFYDRRDGQNEWVRIGSDHFFTSSELLADCANNGDEPAFTPVHDIAPAAAPAPRVLTTVEELDSEEASKAQCLVPNDGFGIVALHHRTSGGKNQWVGVGHEHIYTSVELIDELASSGDTPAFTLIEKPEAN